MRRDDRDDPFDEFFEEIERMMNDVMGDVGEFRIDHTAGGTGHAAAAGAADVHYEVHESAEEVRVVADLPGVAKEAIDLRCDGDTLSIEAPGGDRDYRERVRLPTGVDERSADASYNNGILEVAFDAVDDSTAIDV
jgi:HSP20 family protein